MVNDAPARIPERFEEISASVNLSKDATLEELKQAATAHLANWELPRHWEVV